MIRDHPPPMRMLPSVLMTSATSPLDPEQYYNQIIGGTWAPYGLAAVSSATGYCDNGPSFMTQGKNGPSMAADSIGNIASCDIVFTSDMTKWTRCVVFEEQDVSTLSEGHALKLDPRASYSIDQYGNFATTMDSSTDVASPNYIAPKGMGWFPGYAINVETGERLNMAYGEDSWLSCT